MEISCVIKQQDAGKKIREFVLENYPLSHRALKWLRFNSDISVDGNKMKISNLIPEHSGSLQLMMDYPSWDPDQQFSFEDLEVLYEDDFLLAVWKPAGIPVHLSGSEETKNSDCMCSRVQGYLHANTAYPVGRLDLEVAGIMIFGKNFLAASMLEEQRNRGKLKKTYTALCYGAWKNTEGTIIAPIAKTDVFNRYEVREDGKEAISDYKVLSNKEPYSLVEVQIRTGRTHQIRLHMKHAGHPIAGDQYYGIPDEFKHTQLYATRLELEHPVSHEKITIEKIPDGILNQNKDKTA